MERNEILHEEKNQMQLDVPVIGILRGIDASALGPLMQAAFAAGLQALEVTMNTPEAEKIIAANRGGVAGGKYLGMGTIRNLAEARKAQEAGAMFFVTPNLDPEVIRFAGKNDIPVVAGALTPSEVYEAWGAGAAMVKVFPCSSLGGPQYIRELRGPFDHIPLVAVGGVTSENVTEYLRSGATAVGVGLSLFGEQAVRAGDWDGVHTNVERFIRRCT